jgi:hypothetical protein
MGAVIGLANKCSVTPNIKSAIAGKDRSTRAGRIHRNRATTMGGKASCHLTPGERYANTVIIGDLIISSEHRGGPTS